MLVAEGDEGGEGETAAGAFTGQRDVGRIEAGGEQEAVGGKGVLEGGGEGVLGGQAVVEREGAGVGLTAGLGDHVAMAADRAGDVGAAVEEQQHAVRVGGLGRGPLGGDAAGVGGFGAHVGGDRVAGAEGVEAFAALGQAGRARARLQERPDGVEFGVGHAVVSRAG